jgi:hypothetical protein
MAVICQTEESGQMSCRGMRSIQRYTYLEDILWCQSSEPNPLTFTKSDTAGELRVRLLAEP